MASVAPPAKILLKSSTKISLNDRFSNIMKSGAKSAQTVRAQMASERLASEKNRRLAKQMENRPSVAAALGGGGGRGRRGNAGGSSAHQPSTRSNVQQRLGVTNTGARGRGNVRGGRVALIRGLSRQAGLRGLRRGATSRNTFSPRQLTRGGRRGRGFATSGARGGGGQAQQSNNHGFNNNFNSPPRGGRGRGNSRGRGRGRGRGGRGKPASREDLDTQLDSYMSKTKSSLDKDLNEYMMLTD